jgi:hypothetical protein
MINAINLILSRVEQDAAPVPTFMLFSTDPAADARLLECFSPVSTGRMVGERIQVTWTLPDPDITLGTVALTRTEANEHQARNRAFGGIQLLLVDEESSSKDAHVTELKPYYVDWLGALGGKPIVQRNARVAPVTGLGCFMARFWREQSQLEAAVRALIDEASLVTRTDGTFKRHMAYTLHEAAVVAEQAGDLDAWDYFETVALTIYPNCHDALIGLAMCANNNLEAALPLLGRAYAVRSQVENLRLFAHTFGRRTGQSAQTVHDAILAHASRTDLASHIFKNANGKPLTISAEEVIVHLQALAERVAV